MTAAASAWPDLLKLQWYCAGATKHTQTARQRAWAVVLAMCLACTQAYDGECRRGVLTMCQACTQAYDGERGRVRLPCARRVTQMQACDGERGRVGVCKNLRFVGR